ncbi:MAG: glycosyltransferase family 4 protein [Verrucomicrobiales bacterium]
MEESNGLKIALVHYHLRRGGVTRVIEATREALRGKGYKIVVLSGEPPLPDAGQKGVKVVQALDYRKTGSLAIAGNLTEALKEAALEALGSMPDVWHFHNPNLAKNVMIPTVVQELAEQGEKIVLQLHDFAEDGRPGNYTSQRSFFDSQASFEKTLYPTAKQIHYATINQRDHDFLKAAGIRRRNLHVIPNAIPDLAVKTSPEERPFSKDKLFALYPTRGIRRKNIGELLLLALIYGERVHFATTLKPENPEWQAVHARWEAAVEELDLPVTLGIAEGDEYDFLDLLGWADFVVTTSVAEGFGLAFLEPWIVGKCVLGRDLPEITDDFVEHGLELDTLYRRIDFPVSWLDENELHGEMESMLRRSYLAYNCRLPRGAVKSTWKAWVKKGRIDFGVLNESLQLRVLRKLKRDPSLLDEVTIPPLSLSTAKEIRERRDIIRSAYSLKKYSDRLEELYWKVDASRVGKVGYLATGKVLDQFLSPTRLNLLRN